MPRRAPRLAACVLLLPAPLLHAQSAPRMSGPLIHSAGEVFHVPEPTFPTPREATFRLAFEVAEAAPSPDRLSVSLNTVARYLNMHAQAGVPRERIRAAVVVHGPAGWELLEHAAYRERYGVDNPNVELLGELLDAGVRVVLCGQTASSRGIPRAGLVDGVEVALSAMTALYVLQEEGYRVNPF